MWNLIRNTENQWLVYILLEILIHLGLFNAQILSQWQVYTITPSMKKLNIWIFYSYLFEGHEVILYCH